MERFKYVGKCAKGEVEFSRPGEPKVVMPHGKPVEVPAWLAAKLRHNNHFEAVEDEAPPADGEGSDEAPPDKPKKRGRKAK